MIRINEHTTVKVNKKFNIHLTTIAGQFCWNLSYNPSGNNDLLIIINCFGDINVGIYPKI